MMREDTKQKLYDLNLAELVSAIEEQEKNPQYEGMTFTERLDLAVDAAYQSKYSSQVKRLLSQAKLRFPDADAVNIYYTDRELDREKMLRLATCQFMETHRNVIFQGFTGSGKSWLACCIAKEACKRKYRTRYIRMPDLLTLYEEASVSKTGVSKLLTKWSNYDLLILDEFLLNDLTQPEQLFLFELIERRYDKASTMFCTQYRMEDWHTRLGGGVHADAILDRIVHNVEVVYAGRLNMRDVRAVKAR